MGLTIAEKILSEHCEKEVRAGEITVAKIEKLPRTGAYPSDTSSRPSVGTEQRTPYERGDFRITYILHFSLLLYFVQNFLS